MNTPAPLTPAEILAVYQQFGTGRADGFEAAARAIESARDALWQKMLGDGKAVAWRYHTVSAFPDKDGMLKVSDKWTLIPSPNQRDAHSATCGFACIPLFTHPAPDHTALLRQALEALESFKLPEESIVGAQAGNLILRVPMQTVEKQAAAHAAIKEALNGQSK